MIELFAIELFLSFLFIYMNDMHAERHRTSKKSKNSNNPSHSTYSTFSIGGCFSLHSKREGGVNLWRLTPSGPGPN